MNRQRLLLVCLYTLLHIVFYQDGVAQNTQINKIGILPVKYESSSQADAARQVTDLLYDEFVSGKRAGVINREFFSDLQNEKELSSSIDFLNGELLDKTRSEGAKFLLIGKITSYNIEQTKHGNYSCQLAVGLRVINVETGRTEYSSTLKNNSNFITDLVKNKASDTKGRATSLAVNELKKGLKKFLNKHFPYEGNILEIHKERKGKAKEVLVSIGSNDGVTTNDKYVILTRKEKTIQNEMVVFDSKVGEGVIKEINAGGVSTLSIKKGGETILTSFNSGVSLIIKPKL